MQAYGVVIEKGKGGYSTFPCYRPPLPPAGQSPWLAWEE
jgi:hypothetical protein